MHFFGFDIPIRFFTFKMFYYSCLYNITPEMHLCHISYLEKKNNEVTKSFTGLYIGMEDLRTRLNSFPTEAVSNIEEFQCLMKELESTQDSKSFLINFYSNIL